MTDMPYFMTNEKWYKVDIKKRIYVLTANAPEKAKKSYKDYYSQVYGGKK